MRILSNGIYTYRGLPYAKAERFMAPQKIQPWSGTRLALSYGTICPQPMAQPNEPQTFISTFAAMPGAEAVHAVRHSRFPRAGL